MFVRARILFGEVVVVAVGVTVERKRKEKGSWGGETVS